MSSSSLQKTIEEKSAMLNSRQLIQKAWTPRKDFGK